MVQVLFPNNDAIFQDDNSPIHTARSVQSRFEKHEYALQHLLWLAQLPTLCFMEPLWSVLESRVRNRFPSSSLKQLEEEWYSIPLETIQNLCMSVPRRIQAVLQLVSFLDILINKCVYFTAVSIIFVYPLYMLPS